MENIKTPSPPCRFFAKGTCRFGARCKWSHDQQQPNTDANSPRTFPRNGRQQTASRVESKGSRILGFGAADEYRPLNGRQATIKGKERAISPPPSPPENVTRIIGGTISATFGPGAAILSLIPIAHNTPTIKLDNLPPDVTVTDIITLVAILKPDLTERDILLIPRDDSSSATVRFNDVVIANSALEILSDAAFHDRILKATAVKRKEPHEPSSDRCQIVVSWWRPSKSVILSCASKEMRTAVLAKAQDPHFRLAGRRVGARAQGTVMLISGQAMRYPVQLCDLAADIDIEEVRRAFPECDHGVKFWPTGEQAVETSEVVSLLENEVLGGGGYTSIRLWENEHAVKMNRQLATISFDTTEQFKEAERRLADTMAFKEANHINLGFHSAVDYNVSFAVNKEIHEAISAEIRAVEKEVRESLGREAERIARGRIPPIVVKTLSGKKPWKPTELRVREQTYQRNLVFVRVSGANRDAVVRMKNTVGTLVRGHQLRDEERMPIWDAALLGPEGRKLLDGVTAPLGVFAYCDERNQRVTIHGPRQACADAAVALRELHASIVRNTHQIALSPQQRINCVLGVLDEIRKYLQGGEGRATLTTADMESTLVVRCADFQLEVIQTMLNQPCRYRPSTQRSKATDKGKQPANIDLSDTDTCPICFCPPEQPAVRPTCGHTYCRECLVELLKNSVRFPLQCSAATANDTGSCNTPLGLPFLADFMSASELTSLLGRSFGEYVRQNPILYRYCPTPECPSVYPVAAPPTSAGDNAIPDFTCAHCFLTSCTACHAPAHTGETCIQRATHEAAFNEWTAGNANVKRCPRCEAVIEKNDGCNHMECKCGAHFCWTCMGVFPPLEIYIHMERCGGVFPPPCPVPEEEFPPLRPAPEEEFPPPFPAPEEEFPHPFPALEEVLPPPRPAPEEEAQDHVACGFCDMHIRRAQVVHHELWDCPRGRRPNAALAGGPQCEGCAPPPGGARITWDNHRYQCAVRQARRREQNERLDEEEWLALERRRERERRRAMAGMGPDGPMLEAFARARARRERQREAGCVVL